LLPLKSNDFLQNSQPRREIEHEFNVQEMMDDLKITNLEYNPIYGDSTPNET